MGFYCVQQVHQLSFLVCVRNLMRKIACLYALLGAFLLVFPSSGYAQNLVSVKSSQSQEIITLSLHDNSSHKIFTLGNPDRLVVDVPLVEGNPNISLPASYKGSLIKSIRFGRFDSSTSRFVFDLSRGITVVGSNDNEEGKLILTIAPGSSEKEAKSGTVLKKKRPTMPVVMIDAGHGGDDPGTNGPKGTLEKTIVLEYAKALKTRLVNGGKYQVKLTRDSDKFIKLRDRVAIARKAGAVIFISLHADSAPESAARGLSVYTVSETASDQEAEALAARENKADVISGMDLTDERDDVAGILISLAQRDTKNQSATLADMLVMKLGDRVHLLENTHRFAGFAVLKAPDIPSVLVEIGFLSNASEEKLLKSRAYRDKVVSGVASGIDAYFRYQATSEGE
jgi:N-acetylmuramoyl-L-alanine amidase